MALTLLDRMHGPTIAQSVQLAIDTTPAAPRCGLTFQGPGRSSSSPRQRLASRSFASRLEPTVPLRSSDSQRWCHERQTVAFVLYPGPTPLDLIGPLQVMSGLEAVEEPFGE